MDLYDHIIVEGKIADGSKSKVYLGRLISNGKKVILKQMNSDSKNLQTELEVDRRIACGHLNLLCFVGEYVTESSVFIAYEYVSNAKTLFETDTSAWDDIDILSCIYQLVSAVEFLHNHGVYHLDIKPQNIIVKGKIPMLIDYDGSMIIEQGPYSLKGTPNYMAPEMWTRFKKRKMIFGEISEKTDVYSLGVTFYEIIQKRLPFEHEVTNELALMVMNPDISAEPSKIELINQMISKKPENRPSIQEIKRALEQLIKN